MVVVVVKYIADGLVQHGEQTGESSQPGVVHDMLEGLSVLQAFRHDCICSKVWLQNGCTLPLNLSTKTTHRHKDLLIFSVCLTGNFFLSYSMLGRIPQNRTFGVNWGIITVPFYLLINSVKPLKNDGGN